MPGTGTVREREREREVHTHTHTQAHTHTHTHTAMVPWDLKSSGVDHNSSILTVKCNTMMPHPTQPDKCIITTLYYPTPKP